ncbi:hypothetical protein RND81_11G169100 [Saponaria officinalis]|uniref:CRM domain-containing protein n=1 Tax=Saponaria officinalis TaxID=3572 RepID=A0AAW1HPP1_SAPOF
MSTATMATQHLLHHLIFRQLRLTTTATFSLHRNNNHKKLPLLHLTRPLSTTLPVFCTLQQNNHHTTQNYDKIEEIKTEVSEIIEEEEKVEKVVVLEKREVPVLSVKEKKELGSYANSLGDKLKAQQIGKSGVTANVAFALDEVLESNELVKLKIHRSCPGELEDVIRQLEQVTGSVVVGQIGCTVILYRPSVTKLKAEQKKEQNRKIFEQKRKKFLASPSVVQRWRKSG